MPASSTAKLHNCVIESSSERPVDEVLSTWSVSGAKRICDIIFVLVCLPALGPILISIAIAVYLCSGPPVLFRQTRVGRGGRPFRIYKFRTMAQTAAACDNAIASFSPDQITAIGRFLRHFKLDELPQVFNILAGEMSLVGPRPKISTQQFAPLSCRPGITGSATLAFAREDALFARISKESLADYYQTVVLPAKQQIDSEYMARATLLSDLNILIRTVTGRWAYGAEIAAQHELKLASPPLPRDVYGAQPLE